MWTTLARTIYQFNKEMLCVIKIQRAAMMSRLDVEVGCRDCAKQRNYNEKMVVVILLAGALDWFCYTETVYSILSLSLSLV